MTQFYLASYGKGDKKGIYIVDYKDNKLSLVKQIKTKDYPSYMIRDDKHLYVAFKNSSLLSDGGGLGIYEIKKDDLVEKSLFSSNGRSYTHLCLSPDKNYLFTANYHVGATASYKLKNNKVEKKIGAIHHHGMGPDPLKRQQSSHVHNVGITPDEKYLYAVDLGADKVVMYDYSDGELKEQEDHTLNVIAGCGPRHMIFSKDGKFAYLVNECTNSVLTYSYNDGYFTLIQIIRCVPRHFHGFSSAAAIRMTSDGKHLMISNRGHDSIVLYRINNETGKLSLLYMVHTAKGPRDFNIVDDKLVIVACEGSNVIQVMTFDGESEELVLTETTLSIPSPVCVTI